MTYAHATYMELALLEATQALEKGDVPVGAVLVFEGGIIAKGHNTREAARDPLGHAELNVLQAGARHLGRWRLTGCTLYVTLEPCPMCAAALVAARIDCVVFGASDPKQGAAGSIWNFPEDKRLNHKVAVIAGIEETACATLLRDFFKTR
jgi:tRNA(adenine34) deaminase